MNRKCDVILGDSDGIQVKYAFDGRQENNHMLVLGISGCGKSTMLEKLEKEVVENGKKVVEMDFSDSTNTKKLLSAKSRVIQIKGSSMFTPFVRYYNVYGVLESFPDYAGRISNLLSGALNLTTKQKGMLYSAVKEESENGCELTFSRLCNCLNPKDVSSAGIRTKIQYLADENIFGGNTATGWEKLFEHPKSITVLSLAGFPAGERKLIAELLLDDLRNYLMKCGPGYLDFILVLDECQNLCLTPDMPTAFFLSQGRKYGCGVWLATQSSGCFNRKELTQLYQPALILNFQPSVDERFKICKKLAHNGQEYQKLLRVSGTLRKGEFLASGSFVRSDGTLSNYGTIKINKSEP